MHVPVLADPHLLNLPTFHPQNAADQVAANYHSLISGHGLLPVNMVDKARGY